METQGTRPYHLWFQLRYWRICMDTASCTTSHWSGTVGPGVCKYRARRCGPGRITSLGQTSICSVIYLSRTPVTTRITTWSWGASADPPRGGISATLGGIYRSIYTHQRHCQERTCFCGSIEDGAQTSYDQEVESSMDIWRYLARQ